MRYRLFFAVLILLFVTSQASTETPKKYLQKSNTPLHITANTLTALDKKGIYIFKGDVIAKQGLITLKADEMKVYKNLKTGQISKVVCIGHVVITKQNKKATADKAVYNALTSEITLLGNATVTSGKNRITSNLIIYYLNKDYVVSQGSKSKQVEVTIYPNKKENK